MRELATQHKGIVVITEHQDVVEEVTLALTQAYIKMHIDEFMARASNDIKTDIPRMQLTLKTDISKELLSIFKLYSTVKGVYPVDDYFTLTNSMYPPLQVPPTYIQPVQHPFFEQQPVQPTRGVMAPRTVGPYISHVYKNESRTAVIYQVGEFWIEARYPNNQEHKEYQQQLKTAADQAFQDAPGDSVQKYVEHLHKWLFKYGSRDIEIIEVTSSRQKTKMEFNCMRGEFKGIGLQVAYDKSLPHQSVKEALWRIAENAVTYIEGVFNGSIQKIEQLWELKERTRTMLLDVYAGIYLTDFYQIKKDHPKQEHIEVENLKDGTTGLKYKVGEYKVYAILGHEPDQSYLERFQQAVERASKLSSDEELNIFSELLFSELLMKQLHDLKVTKIASVNCPFDVPICYTSLVDKYFELEVAYHEGFFTPDKAKEVLYDAYLDALDKDNRHRYLTVGKMHKLEADIVQNLADKGYIYLTKLSKVRIKDRTQEVQPSSKS